MLKPQTPTMLHRQAGFSLMELAIVLMIIGTLMGGVLVAISDSFENGRRSAALNQLRQIEEALYGFAASHGRLPCPTDPTATADVGEEACPPPESTSFTSGFLPRVLGLSGRTNDGGIVLDPWGNPYLYIARDEFIIDPTTLNLQFGSPITPLLVVATESGCAANVLNDTFVAIIISQGANGTTATSDNELENSIGNECFVSAPYAEDIFDDQLLWISPYILFNRMISAGRLP